MPEVCVSCRAPVIWARTESGKLMPVDPDPVEDGNILLSHRQVGEPPVAVVQGTLDVELLRAQHERRAQGTGEGPFRLFRSHFASCPEADAHRKPRSREGAVS